MNPNKASHPARGKVLPARRLTLLASVVGLGAAVFLGGPGYRAPTLPALASPAYAAEAAQHPAGFADLVARVKPAVVSVRVKIDRENTASMNENGGDKMPFEDFFRQFGFENGRGAARPRHQMVTGEGSGSFISAKESNRTS